MNSFTRFLASVLIAAVCSNGCSDEKNPVTPFPDYRPPTVEWVSINSGVDFQSTVSDTVEIVFLAHDDSGIDSARLYLDGVCRFSQSPTSIEGGVGGVAFTFTWNTLNDSDGVHSVEARAWDNAGNSGETPVLLMRVANTTPPPAEDSTPPDLWWEAPAGGTTLSDTVRLIIRYFDESGVDSIRLMKDGSVAGTYSVSGTRGSLEALWLTKNDSDGVHLWEARGWDASGSLGVPPETGNMGVSPALLVRVKNNPEPPPQDVRPPVIVWVAPQPGDTVQGTVELRFDVMDDVSVDSARVYINGGSNQNLLITTPEIQKNVSYLTLQDQDGNYLITVRAWDRAGNVGASVGVVLTVWNNRPRVIWVPDDYEKIQDAINASVDGDTVRVRAGTYPGNVQFFAKNVSLISEDGPEQTTIDGTGFFTALWVAGGQDTSMTIRGFTLICWGESYSSIIIGGGASPRMVNNIFIGNLSGDGILADQSSFIVRNNLFLQLSRSGQFAHNWGDFRNNMIILMSDQAFFSSAINGQPLIPDYNLFWEYSGYLMRGNHEITWGVHNILDMEPIFEQDSFRLRIGSPGIDQGDPNIHDLDGTRSNIGVYGGPNAYR